VVRRDNAVLVGLVGTGIRASLSPALHEREGRAHGLDYTYQVIDAGERGFGVDDLPRLLRSARELGFRGLNVTHPFKQAVVAHLDALSPDAAALAAVNTVVFDGEYAIGHNTDWSGFARSFALGLPDAATGQVVQLGAGGAGAAVAHAALTVGVDHLHLVDTDPARSADLANALAERFGADRVCSAERGAVPMLLAEADGLVHATPVGMAAHPGLPLPAELLHPQLWVAEVVYRPLRTALLAAAQQAGCRILHGGGMAVHQAADAFRLFTGLEPDAERMLAHLAELTDEPAAADTTPA